MNLDEITVTANPRRCSSTSNEREREDRRKGRREREREKERKKGRKERRKERKKERRKEGRREREEGGREGKGRGGREREGGREGGRGKGREGREGPARPGRPRATITSAISSLGIRAQAAWSDPKNPLGMVGRLSNCGRRSLLRHPRGLPEGSRHADWQGTLPVRDRPGSSATSTPSPMAASSTSPCCPAWAAGRASAWRLA